MRTNDADTLVKMRLGHARDDSDEDSMEEDSNSSCNDMLNSRCSISRFDVPIFPNHSLRLQS